MTSFLFISQDQMVAEKVIDELCQEKQIDMLDKTIFDLATTESKTGTKKSWGIDDIKLMQKKICLKPLRGAWKAVIIKDADLLTLEAQNALLKTLEEPPDGTLLFLTASSIEPFLPTILSRCTIRFLGEKQIVSIETKEAVLSELEEIRSGTIGTKLKKAEQLSKNKEDVLTFIRNAILALHDDLGVVTSSETVQLLKLLQEHYKLLKHSNTNLRLATEHLFLSFPNS